MACCSSSLVGSAYDPPTTGLSTKIRPISECLASRTSNVQLRPAGGDGTVNGDEGLLKLKPPSAQTSSGASADVAPASENVAAIVAPNSAHPLLFIGISIPRIGPC